MFLHLCTLIIKIIGCACTYHQNNRLFLVYNKKFKSIGRFLCIDTTNMDLSLKYLLCTLRPALHREKLEALKDILRVHVHKYDADKTCVLIDETGYLLQSLKC